MVRITSSLTRIQFSLLKRANKTALSLALLQVNEVCLHNSLKKPLAYSGTAKKHQEVILDGEGTVVQ